MPPVIALDQLRKVYQVPVREAGMRAAARSLFARDMRDVVAVGGVSFTVEPGEVVGFLGPNGAGKTTTLKMLSGLLHPTSGSARVLGFEPWQRKRDFLRRITLVMGNRQQLMWDIPAADSFDLNRAVYRIPTDDYARTRRELVEMLDLGDLIKKPVRNLSLGERMKCEIAASLLHSPQVLFLDEPTLGLDVTMQRRIRAFVQAYNQRHGATVLLTSHYMADVEALCKRVVVIHHGTLLFDGDLSALVDRFSSSKTITIQLGDGAPLLDAAGWARYGAVLVEAVANDAAGHDGDEDEDQAGAPGGDPEGLIRLQVPKAESAAITARLLTELPIVDLTVEETPIDQVIERVFALPGAAAGPAGEPGAGDAP